MSKSLGNTIEIAASPEEIRAKLKPAFTDPARLRRADPGHPEVCAIYTWWQKFAPDGVEQTATECRAATRGCVDCKRLLGDRAIAHFAPLRERRARYEAAPRHGGRNRCRGLRRRARRRRRHAGARARGHSRRVRRSGP